jgi:hypothetical protein
MHFLQRFESCRLTDTFVDVDGNTMLHAVAEVSIE